MPINTTSSEFQKKLLNNNSSKLSASTQILDSIVNDIKNIDTNLKTLEQEIIAKTTQPVNKSNELNLNKFKKDLKDDTKTANQSTLDDKKEIDKINVFVGEKICKKVFEIHKRNSKKFKDLNNYIKKLFKSKYTSFKNVITPIALSMFEKFKNVTFSTFTWIVNKGKFIYSFFKYTLSPVISVLKWVYTGAKKIIGYLYDTVKSLAKIGWKALSTVLETIITPIKEVASYFALGFEAALENPIIFSLFVAGLAIAMYFVIPEVIKIVKSVASWLWDGLVGIVKNVFFEGDQKKLDKFSKDFSDQIKTIFPLILTTIETVYNSTIVKLFPEMAIDNIKKLLDGPISEMLTFAMDIFNFIKTTEIFNDMRTIYRALKVWALTLTDFFTGSNQIAEMEETELKDENKNKYDALVKQKLIDVANSTLLNNLSNEYEKLQYIAGITPDIIKEKLLNYSNTLLSSMENNVNQFTKDKSINYLVMAEVKHNIDRFIDIITTSTTAEKTKILKTSGEKLINASETLARLRKYEDDSTLFQNTIKTADELEYLMSDLFKQLNGKVDINFVNFKDLTIHTRALLENVNNIAPEINGLIKEINLSDNSLKDLNEKMKSGNEGIAAVAITKYNQIIDEMFNSKEFDTIYEEKSKKRYLETLDFRLANSEIYDNVMPFADGGIITSKINALIGEAGYPEIILPITDSGITFIEESIGDLLNISSHKSENDKETPRENIIKQISSRSPQPSTILFDMRNICSGVIGVMR